MQVHKLVIPLLLTMAVNAANADSIFYTFKKALVVSEAADDLDPSVKLSFGKQAAPPIAEKSLPVKHSRSGISIAPFGRDPHVLCMEGFAAVLESMTKDAKRMGFDAIINIRGRMGDGSSFSNDGFDCSAGRRTSGSPAHQRTRVLRRKRRGAQRNSRVTRRTRLRCKRREAAFQRCHLLAAGERAEFSGSESASRIDADTLGSRQRACIQRALWPGRLRG